VFEVGRVALINYGPDCGKLCTIIDVVDAKRVLVDGPQSITGVHRQVLQIKRISLTDIVVKVSRTATVKSLTKAWKEADALATWEASAWAKKLATKKVRSNLSDFDRFKVMVLKKRMNRLVRTEVNKLRKAKK
jgi:large subunit ribosomal protein L14e